MSSPVANIKSQIKRIGTNEKRRLRNKAAKSEVKTRIKSAIYAAEVGDESAAEDLRLAVKRAGQGGCPRDHPPQPGGQP